MNNIYNENDKYININLYDILEISIDASDEEIRKSFKRLALKYHPDKNKNMNGNKKFIDIKYAYDILTNSELKKNYDRKLKNENKNLFYVNIENFIKTTDFNILINLILKNKKNINPYQIFNNINLLKDLLDINLTINYTLKELWDCVPKNIRINRDTKNEFEEIIYPLDLDQIYENEGEKIKINNTLYNGNLNIKINITDKIYNNEQYYIYQNELYILINKNRIINKKFNIRYLDDNEYKFNVEKLKMINNNFGDVYLKKKFGLPKICMNDETIIHGNLFFIFVL